MKGTFLAIIAVALVAGCASDNRGGMGRDTYQDTGAYEPSESTTQPHTMPSVPNEFGFPRRQGPGGTGLGEPH